MDDRLNSAADDTPLPPKPPRRSWLFFEAWLGRTKPYPYAVAGVMLFLLKYALDWSVARFVFGRNWQPANYLVPSAYYSIWSVPYRDWPFYLTLVLLAVPFMGVGLALTVRRLRDANLPIWLSALFFVPFVNLPFFLTLCLLPSVPGQWHRDEPEDAVEAAVSGPPAPGLAGRLPSAAGAALISGLCALALVGSGTHFLRHYGWGLFVGVPFCLGLVSALLHGYYEPRSLKSCYGVTLTSLGIVAAGLLLFAWEGIICLMMASPIALLLSFFGTLVGWAVQNHPRDRGYDGGRRRGTHLLPAVVVILPAVMGGERLVVPPPALAPVRTSVVINASPDQVWRHVVSFSQLPPPDAGDWLFRSGIAYPIRAEIEGCGPGAVRRCVFSTGAFIEPIEVWDEPRLLRFGVTAQPPVMHELSVYGHVHPPHLDGYLQSERGQFLLTELPDGSTRLEGTTWYRNRMWPEGYWRLWSDWIIHRIHLRVLGHVKELAENAPR